jgi:hypothetical protein
MTRSSRIAKITFGSVAFSAVISVVWLITGASILEPAVQIFGLIGGLTGVLAERLAAARERRHLALVTLADELRRDTAILDGPEFAPCKETPRPRVYPRLPVSATDAALTLGALADRSDDELLRLLHNWRDEVNGFNRRLELTEILIFTSENPADIAEFECALHCGDAYLNQVQRQLRDLQNYLAANYQSESGSTGADSKAGQQPRWWFFYRLGWLASSTPSAAASRPPWWRWAGYPRRTARPTQAVGYNPLRGGSDELAAVAPSGWRRRYSQPRRRNST